MNWLSELNVGDLVYIVPTDRRFNKPYHAQVTRKGRKFAYLAAYRAEDNTTSRHEVKADITNPDHVMTSVNVGSGAWVFRTFDHYVESQEIERMRRRIFDSFRSGRHATDEQVKQIAAILNINGEPDA